MNNEKTTNNKQLWLGIGVAIAIIAAIIALLLSQGTPVQDADLLADRGAEPEPAPVVAASHEPEAPVSYPDDPTIVAAVNGIHISAHEVLFELAQAENMLMWEYFMMFPEAMETMEFDYDREFGDGLTFGRVLLETAVRLAATPKLYEEYASNLGIFLSDEAVNLITEEVDDLVEQFGRQTFDEMLWGERIQGREHLESIYYSFDLIGLLIDTLLESPDKFADFEPYMPPEVIIDEELLAAKHILANFDNFASEEEAEEFAQELLTRALAGEDFDMLIANYGQDPGMQMNPEGYTFVSGVMVREFELATRELLVGEIAGLVRSDFGFHIIKRVEPDETNVMRPQGAPQAMSLEERMVEAIHTRFEMKLDEAEIVFFPSLDDIEL